MLVFVMAGLGLLVLIYFVMISVQLIRIERAIEDEMLKVEVKVSKLYQAQ